MIDNELGPDVRALLAAGREGLGPDAATIARLRSRIDAAVAAAPAGPAKALGVKLTVVAIATTVGAGMYAANGAASTAATPVIASVEPAVELDVTTAIGAHESAPPPPAEPIASASFAAIQEPVAVRAAEPALIPFAEPPVVEPARISLAREIELVDRATLGLRTRTFSSALDALATYDRETHGEGQLALEASAIKIEVLCRTADPRAATELAAFLQRWPRSPQRNHLRATCAKEKQ